MNNRVLISGFWYTVPVTISVPFICS
jgi:hypothetical protein